MMSWNSLNRALVVFSLAWVLTGCRFGNYEKDQQSNDTISGFYETEANGLSFYTKTYTGAESNVAVADLTLVPQFLSGILTNPVALQIEDPTNMTAQIFSPYQNASTFAIPVSLFSTAPNLQGDAGLNPIKDSTCTVQTPTCSMGLEIATVGNYIQESGPFHSGVSAPLKGRLAMNVQVGWAFSGSDCSFVMSCYFDATKCQQTTFDQNNCVQGWIKKAVDPFIKANVVTTSNFQNYSNFQYSVSYQ